MDFRRRVSLDAGLLSHPDAGHVTPDAPPPYGPAMVGAGRDVVAGLTSGRALSVVLSIDGALDELQERAPWACWLLAERDLVGTSIGDPDAADIVGSGPYREVDARQLQGLWRLVTRPTPMGDGPTGWSFLIGRWLIAPLLPPAQTASVGTWVRVLHNGGEPRRRARHHARLAVADALECERCAGPELWSDLCRSQFVHPVQIAAVGNLIQGAVARGLASA